MRDTLEDTGTLHRVFDQQDSGCISYAWSDLEGTWLIKVAQTEEAQTGLRRAWRLHQEVSHSALVAPVRRIEASHDAPFGALVFPFVSGELLYDYTRWSSHERQHHPDSPHLRFRQLPTHIILQAYDAILDAHVAIERAGWVATDLYDGCLLYDFEQDSMRLIDLDEYRPGPFVVEGARLPGSRRFMAPEEFCQGARIDARTNVFTLAKMALVLLTLTDDVWSHGDDALHVLERATQTEPQARFASVEAFVSAWRVHASKIARPRT